MNEWFNQRFQLKSKQTQTNSVYTWNAALSKQSDHAFYI